MKLVGELNLKIELPEIIKPCIESEKASPICRNIDGAPFELGQRVRVTSVVDDTANSSLLNTEGFVEYYDYSCGCGQTYPTDPMIGVQFGEIIEEFWKEEIESAN